MSIYLLVSFLLLHLCFSSLSFFFIFLFNYFSFFSSLFLHYTVLSYLHCSVFALFPYSVLQILNFYFLLFLSLFVSFLSLCLSSSVFSSFHSPGLLFSLLLSHPSFFPISILSVFHTLLVSCLLFLLSCMLLLHLMIFSSQLFVGMRDYFIVLWFLTLFLVLLLSGGGCMVKSLFISYQPLVSLWDKN